MENNRPISEWTLAEARVKCVERDGRCYDVDTKTYCPLADEPGQGRKVRKSQVRYWNVPVATDTDVARKPAKPRLAEILGVKVGEKFNVKNFDDENIGPFHIDADGFMRWCNEDGETSDESVYIAINHPEKIIRIPRLTEAERAICKAVGAKWVSKNKYGARRVTLWDAKPIFDEGMFSIPEDDEHSVTIGVIGRISDILFPSVKPGDCIEVEAQNAKVQ